MAARGELLIHPGHTVKVALLLEQARERFGEPALIASDYHRRAELRDALDEARVPAAKLELRRGGYNDGAEDVARFRRAVLDRTVRARASLLLATAVGEARTVEQFGGTGEVWRPAARADAASLPATMPPPPRSPRLPSPNGTGRGSRRRSGGGWWWPGEPTPPGELVAAVEGREDPGRVQVRDGAGGPGGSRPTTGSRAGRAARTRRTT